MGTHPSEVITNTAQRILEAKKIVADAEQRFATLMQEMETDLARVLKDQEHVHDREPREHSSAGLVQAPAMSVFSPTPRINKQRGRPKGSRNKNVGRKIYKHRSGMSFRDLVLSIMSQRDTAETAKTIAELIGAQTDTAPPAPEKVYAALQDAKRRDEYVSGPFKGTWVLTHKGKTRVRELESLGVEIAA